MLMVDASLTVDVDHAVTLANQPFRRPENIPEADAEADILHHLQRGRLAGGTGETCETQESTPCLVGILGVDVVLDRYIALLSKVVGRDLHQVGDLGLNSHRALVSKEKKKKTKKRKKNDTVTTQGM